jgi:hypothetical protein
VVATERLRAAPGSTLIAAYPRKRPIYSSLGFNTHSSGISSLWSTVYELAHGAPLQCSRGPVKSFGGDNSVEGGIGLAIARRIVAAENNPVAAILALDPFERFVFVISVLKGGPSRIARFIAESRTATSRLPACWRSSVWQTPTLLTLRPTS